MRRPEILLLIGFTLITVGIILLATAGFDSTEGIVFVFPFLFAGNFNLLHAVLIVAMMFFMAFMLLRFYSGMMPARILQDRDERTPAYMRVGSICPNCNSPVPEGAIFCSACGSPIEDEKENDRYGF